MGKDNNWGYSRKVFILTNFFSLTKFKAYYNLEQTNNLIKGDNYHGKINL